MVWQFCADPRGGAGLAVGGGGGVVAVPGRGAPGGGVPGGGTYCGGGAYTGTAWGDTT
jgi:hypothetical protein